MRLKWGLWPLGWLGVGLCLLACVPQPQPVPIVSASANVQPTASPLLPLTTPTPSPMLEKRADGRFCEPMDVSKIKPALKHPIDLVVSPDGQDLYIVTKRCQDDVSQKPYLDTFTFPDCGSKPDSSNVIPRSYIYHLHHGQGLEILKIENQPPLSCELGEDIEMDSQGRLYVTTPYNHRVYRIDPKQNKLEQMVEAVQKKLLPITSTKTEEILQGPANLFVYKDKVYFRLYESSVAFEPENHIAFINQNNRHIILASFPVGQFKGSPIFMFANPDKTADDKKDLYLYDPKESAHLYRILSPYPSFLNPQSTGVFPIEFNPFSPSDRSSELGNSLLGDMKMDIKTNIYASHPSWHRILEMPESKFITAYENKLYVFAGSGVPGLKDGPGKDAQFRSPAGLALDANQNLYVADMGNHAIRKITADRIVTTLYAEEQR